MANNIHINPNTGRPARCEAKTPEACKYAQDGVVPKHYSTNEEAIEDYAKSMDDKTLPSVSVSPGEIPGLRSKSLRDLRDASNTCPESEKPKHYGTKEEAREAYEREREEFEAAVVDPKEAAYRAHREYVEKLRTKRTADVKTYMDKQDAYYFFSQYPDKGEDTREYVRTYLQGMSYTEDDVAKLAEAHEAGGVAYDHTEEGGFSIIPDEESAREDADLEWDTGAYSYHSYDQLEGSEECNEELRTMGATAQKLMKAYPPEGEQHELERQLFTKIADSPEDTPLEDVRRNWGSLSEYASFQVEEHLEEIASRSK